MESGFLVVDKPPGITSHDAVATVRAVTGIKKVGHTGTLDPFATGVLPLALGGATKLVRFLDESVKVYDATIAFGSATTTGDPTGEIVREAPLPSAGPEDVEQVLRGFLGERLQRPHRYSAVKVRGRPLYHYARRGEEVDAEPRRIRIDDLAVRSYDGQHLRVVVTCSRGTYARVLADEIAEALGTAGHLVALQRPRSGPFVIDDALDFERLAEMVSAEPGVPWQDVLLVRRKEDRVPWRPRAEVLERLRPYLRRPIDALSHLPLAEVRPSDALRVRQGSVPPPAPPEVAVGGLYLVVVGDTLVAVAESTARGPRTVKVVG